jgi:hypothetical protein
MKSQNSDQANATKEKKSSLSKIRTDSQDKMAGEDFDETK